jgi:hypothetical protein
VAKPLLKHGSSPALRHLDCTHAISTAWMYEAFKLKQLILQYINSTKESADIFTKGFTDLIKWIHATRMINHIYMHDISTVIRPETAKVKSANLSRTKDSPSIETEQDNAVATRALGRVDDYTSTQDTLNAAAPSSSSSAIGNISAQKKTRGRRRQAPALALLHLVLPCLLGLCAADAPVAAPAAHRRPAAVPLLCCHLAAAGTMADPGTAATGIGGPATEDHGPRGCPRHRAAGQKAGPHVLGRIMYCGCCAGTCELCQPHLAGPPESSSTGSMAEHGCGGRLCVGCNADGCPRRLEPCPRCQASMQQHLMGAHMCSPDGYFPLPTDQPQQAAISPPDSAATSVSGEETI